MSGISAQYVDGLELRIKELGEQVEKLTKERDTEIARNRPLQSLIKSTEETKSFLLKKSEENKEAVKQLDSERQANAVLTEELAALAEQNEKMRAFLNFAWKDIPMSEYAFEILEHAMNLPNLSTPVLNKYRAEGMRMAAEICEHISDEYREREWCRYPELKTDAESGASDCESSIRARADELENSNG